MAISLNNIESLSAAIADWLAASFTSFLVVCWGKGDELLREHLTDKGIKVHVLAEDQPTSIDGSDNVILICDSNCLLEDIVLMNQLTNIDCLLVIFTIKHNQIDLPDVSKVLSSSKFYRDLLVEPLISDQWLISLYRRDERAGDTLISKYETEIWHWVQAGIKRRNFLQEHYKELEYLSLQVKTKDDVIEIKDSNIKIKEAEISAKDAEIEIKNTDIKTKEALINRKDAEIAELVMRWEAFHNSRTGRVIHVFERLRNTFLPRNGRLGSLIKQVIFYNNRIKREGIKNFLKAFPSRLWKKFRLFYFRFKLRYLSPSSPHTIDLNPVLSRNPCKSFDDLVDIIICVHNALDDLQSCLESITKYTHTPYRLIFIDDGSGDETRKFLEDYSVKNNIKLLRNEEAKGYTRAANLGLKQSSADFILLLNSDVIVTSNWLSRLVCCAKSNPKYGIVGPLSNTASWQSIPKIETHGDWAHNELPEGVTIEQMGELVFNDSSRLYPELPFLNGFCLLIKRELIEEIGYFDEDTFGAGYGEEDDYSIRARSAGWKLALADDAYIYHAQSKSYSNEKRKVLSERAGKALSEKHGEHTISVGVETCQNNKVLEGIRAHASILIERQQIKDQGKRFSGKRILYLMPVATPGGGANVIITESLAMREMGVETVIYNLLENQAKFEEAYPNLDIPVHYGDIDDIRVLADEFDALIATYNPTVEWLDRLDPKKTRPVFGYYIQGFEPLMYPENSDDYLRALKSYSLMANMARFTKTKWTKDIIFENTGIICEIIGVSLDIELFRPRSNIGISDVKRPIRISAMIRPESHYREPQKTMELLRKSALEFGSRVEICLFGTDINNPDFQALPNDFPWTLYGVLPTTKVAALLSQTDIFVDYSSHQAMGLTALEAMACGNAVIVPENGGAVSFAKHEENSLVVDSNSFNDVWESLKRLIENDKLRTQLQSRAIHDVCLYFPERAAYNILCELFDQ